MGRLKQPCLATKAVLAPLSKRFSAMAPLSWSASSCPSPLRSMRPKTLSHTTSASQTVRSSCLSLLLFKQNQLIV